VGRRHAAAGRCPLPAACKPTDALPFGPSPAPAAASPARSIAPTPPRPPAPATSRVLSVTETLHNLPKPPYLARALAATALSTALLSVANV
jgi:hypothetical protein